MLLAGTGRFQVLWEDDKISSEFGILAGVSKASVEEVIRQPTLSGKKRITGRQLLSKAKNCIREVKIILAYWTDFKKNGGFPSGKNFDDALKFCVESVRSERYSNLEKDDISDSDSEEEAPPPAKKSKPAESKENESDNEYNDNEDDEEEEGDVEYGSTKSFSPPALLTFMLLGPYGVDAFGFELSAAFSVDTEGIEENAKTGMYNTKSMKEEKKNITDQAR